MEATEQFFTYNPDCFDDEQWSYRDLQKLCIKMELGGRGKRKELVQKLQDWNQKKLVRNPKEPVDNFTLLEADVNVAVVGNNRRKSGVRKTGGGMTISPRLLSPLTKKPRRQANGNPIGILSPSRSTKSYMKWLAQKSQGPSPGTKRKVSLLQDNPDEEEPTCKTPDELSDDDKENEGQSPSSHVNKKRRISFSVLNGVKLISPRNQNPDRQSYYEYILELNSKMDQLEQDYEDEGEDGEDDQEYADEDEVEDEDDDVCDNEEEKDEEDKTTFEDHELKEHEAEESQSSTDSSFTSDDTQSSPKQHSPTKQSPSPSKSPTRTSPRLSPKEVQKAPSEEFQLWPFSFSSKKHN
mmetsp:Transcript_30154/g.59041  ORF Transcript_30154/g.59041 Transcript_30154/m.59041 type:complete len:352 (+) Transcript_30154:36-1091(+)